MNTAERPSGGKLKALEEGSPGGWRHRAASVGTQRCPDHSPPRPSAHSQQLDGEGSGGPFLCPSANAVAPQKPRPLTSHERPSGPENLARATLLLGPLVPHTNPPRNSGKWILSLSCFFLLRIVNCLQKESDKPNIQHDHQCWTQKYQVKAGEPLLRSLEQGFDAEKQGSCCSNRGQRH